MNMYNTLITPYLINIFHYLLKFPAVASTCQEFIISRFSLSDVFNCEQFPDSTDPAVCFDMTYGKCNIPNNMYFPATILLHFQCIGLHAKYCFAYALKNVAYSICPYICIRLALLAIFLWVFFLLLLLLGIISPKNLTSII